MSEFEKWTRGDLAAEGSRPRIPRKREPWKERHDQVFSTVWGQQSSRVFPQPQRDPPPTIKPTRRKPGHRLGLLLLAAFAAGLVTGLVLAP